MRPPRGPYVGPKRRSCPFHVGQTRGAGSGATTGYRGSLIHTCYGCGLAVVAVGAAGKGGRPSLPYGGPKVRSCPFHVGTSAGGANHGERPRSRNGYRKAYAGECIGCTLADRAVKRAILAARHGRVDQLTVDAVVTGHRLKLTRAEREEAIARLERAGYANGAEIARLLRCHPRTVSRARRRMAA